LRTVVTDADGLVTRYVYDGLNRLVEIQYPDAIVEYAYDALGRRTAMTDTTGVTTYTYDDLGWLVSVADPFTGTVEYAYDLTGNRTAMTVTTESENAHATHYVYDGDNRLIRVTDWATGTTTYGYDAAGQLITTTLPNGVVMAREYDDAGQLTNLTHRKADGTLLAAYSYVLNGVGNTTLTTEILVVSGTATTRIITNTYDALNRQTASAYSTGETFAYRFDAVGNRQQMTSTTPLSGTVVTTYTFDAANRLTDRAVSDGRTYTYTWSHRGQMLTEWTNGVPVRTFDYDGSGQMVQATVFTLTTDFVYNGLGARVAVSVAGQTTRYTLDYAAGNRVLAESTPTSTIHYLYGHDCLGQYTNAESLYYLPDATGYVRQGVDEDGAVVSVWLFDPDGTLLEGPEGLVNHLVCGGVYDWSTGLIYQNGGYFDPNLGLWLALMPLVVIQAWPGKKKRRGGQPWVMVLCMGWLVIGTLTACGAPTPDPTPNPTPTETPCTELPASPTLLDFRSTEPAPPAPYLFDDPIMPAIELGDLAKFPDDTMWFMADFEIPDDETLNKGEIWFVQNVRLNRTRTFLDGRREILGDNETWYLDTYIPYDAVPPDSVGLFTAITSDAPSVALYEVNSLVDTPKHTLSEVTVDENFKMFVGWKWLETDSPIYLGMISWGWRAKAQYNRNTGKWDLAKTPEPDIWADKWRVPSELPVLSPVADLQKFSPPWKPLLP